MPSVSVLLILFAYSASPADAASQPRSWTGSVRTTCHHTELSPIGGTFPVTCLSADAERVRRRTCPRVGTPAPATAGSRSQLQPPRVGGPVPVQTTQRQIEG